MHSLNRFAIVGLAAGMFLITARAATPGKDAVPGHVVKSDSALDAAKTKKEPDKTILFFMNPNGRPCQMQKAILDSLHEQLAGLANIKYVKATESSDENTFYQYGIRGLPSLIILDKNGKELKRFTPGIQSAQAILDALNDKGTK